MEWTGKIELTDVDVRIMRGFIHEFVLEALMAQRNGNDAIIVLADEATDKVIEWLQAK